MLTYAAFKGGFLLSFDRNIEQKVVTQNTAQTRKVVEKEIRNLFNKVYSSL